MINDYVGIYGFPAAIILAPLLSIFFWLKLNRYTDQLYTAVAVLLMTILLALFFGISFFGLIADELLKCIMYVLLGVCAFQMCRHRYWYIKTIGVFCSIPIFILPLFVHFYLLAISESFWKPEYTKNYRDEYQCRVTRYKGRDTADRGYTTAIYKKIFVFEYESISSVRIGRDPRLLRSDLCNELFSKIDEQQSI